MTWGYEPEIKESVQYLPGEPAPLITLSGQQVQGLGEFGGYSPPPWQSYSVGSFQPAEDPALGSFQPGEELAGWNPYPNYRERCEHMISQGTIPIVPCDYYERNAVNGAPGWEPMGAPATEEILFIWENKPTQQGLYFLEVELPEAMSRADLNKKYANKKSPFGGIGVAPAFFGAFTRIENGRQVMIMGPDFERDYTTGRLFFGSGEGEYQFHNALYMWGDLRSDMVEKLMWYCVMAEDTDNYGLDPFSTSAYFNNKLELVYLKDATGRTHNPNLPNPTLQAAFLPWFIITFAAFVFSYFGWFGKTAQRVARKMTTKLVELTLKGLKVLGDKLKELAGKALKAGIDTFGLPLLGVGLVLGVVWLIASDSGGS